MTRAGLLFVLPALASALAAQQPARTLTTSRHLLDQQSLRVVLAFEGGDLLIRPAASATLYHFEVMYDPGSATPVSRYDGVSATVTVGLETVRSGAFFVSRSRRIDQRGVLQLTRSIPVTVEGSVTSGDADFDLGGLTLRSLDLTTSATKTTIRFSSPTAGDCTGAIIRSHAAETHLLELGNSRCGSLRFEGDAGPATLDFSGDFPETLRVSIEATLGTVLLRIPRSVGVRLVVDRWLAAIGQDGFTRDGNTWVSSTYGAALHKLDLDLKAAAGGVRIEWLP